MPEVRSIKGLEVRHDYKLGALRLREAPEKRAQAVRAIRHTMLLQKAVSMDGDYHLVINSSGREKGGGHVHVYTHMHVGAVPRRDMQNVFVSLIQAS